MGLGINKKGVDKKKIKTQTLNYQTLKASFSYICLASILAAKHRPRDSLSLSLSL